MSTPSHRVNVILSCALCALTMLAGAGMAATAGSENPQVAGEETQAPPDATTAERLRDQEQRIKEQELRIMELEKRLQQLEAAAMSGEAPAPAAAAVAAPEHAAAAASAPTSIAGATGEARDTHQLLTGADLASEEFPGSWPMFGTNMRMKVGGYLKTDLLYDFDGTLDKYQFLMSTIPVEGTPEYEDSGYVAFFARESRVNVDVRRTTPGAVPLRMFVEGDFWSSGNQFRLRHAYMVAGDFLVGQTWTTLSFLESLPFMIDFAAGDALFGGRASQVRYTKRASDRWKLAVGAESLDYLGIENPYGLAGKASPQFPLFAARADYSWSSGLLLLGTSVAQLRWDGGATGPSDEALQIAGVVAGRQYLGKNSYFTWNVSYGEASGENIMAFTGSNANAVLTADGRLETMPAFAFVGGFWHKWNAVLSSNFSYAYGWLDTPDSRDPLALKRGGIGHVNLVWKPVTQFSTGVEYMWGAQRTQNDALGRAQRFQLMAKYDF